jgi:ATP-dependent protease HslVU (ClpYQ) peptidase subunit
MTTLVAIKRAGTVYVGSDSLTLCGQRRELPNYVDSVCKITRISTGLIGVSGHASWHLVLEQYCKQYPPRFNTFLEITRWARQFYVDLKVHFYGNTFETMLILSQDNIFEVDHRQNVRQFSDFTAIGSGEAYALGTLQALYPNPSLSPEILILKSLIASSKFDLKTEGPFDIAVSDMKCNRFRSILS